MKKISILGAGESGVGAAILAKQQGEEVWVSDAGKIQDRFRSVLDSNHIPFEEGRHTKETFFEADIIVKSPGIPDTVPLIRQLKEKGKAVISEIEYASMHSSARIIAITGSNGKTTTTALTGHLLQQAGVDVQVGGNIGKSFAWQVATSNPECFVLEVSSFQLDNIQHFRPDIALLLNITPDHLDRYEWSLKKYGQAKFRIAENQRPEDVFIYHLNDPETNKQFRAHELAARKWGFSLEQQEGSKAWVEENHLKLGEFEADFTRMNLLGPHNQLNSLAALLAVEAYGASLEKSRRGLETFAPIPHRMEPVAEIEGVRYINDSKATNVESVYYALKSMDRQLIWMVGGIDKGNEYSGIQQLVEDKVREIIVIGNNIDTYRKAFDKPIHQVFTMKDAIDKARELANEGETVLLSPACSSFDLFNNFEDRGNQFRDIVRQMISE
ncbi:MAG: UDP-N-acetylmuramoyl-L-alanine--D-glutamate ligase [Bacteroidota bacterium]